MEIDSANLERKTERKSSAWSVLKDCGAHVLYWEERLKAYVLWEEALNMVFITVLDM